MKVLQRYEIEVLFQHLVQCFASFAYQVFAETKENTYYGMILSMLYGMRFDPISLRTINLGHIDVVLELPKVTYIIELKLDSNAQVTLDQIRKKNTLLHISTKGKKSPLLEQNFLLKNEMSLIGKENFFLKMVNL